jgi:ribosome-associated protein
MKPNKTTESLNSDQEAQEPISKTKLKAAMDELQDIGVTLVGLPKDRLAKLDLPETLLDAIREAKRITANGATRRQMQYIGRLMRNVDTAPILDQLQRWQGKHSAENAYFHKLERWRDRLINEDAALSEFMLEYPNVDSQPLRTLIRNAKRELAANKPPKSSRDLFKLLREVTAEQGSEDIEADYPDET